ALRCDFQDASSDADGSIVSWNWSFGTAGSGEKKTFYVYSPSGPHPVALTVTYDQGVTSTVTKNVNPKAPIVTSLSCVDGSAPGGFVACTLKLEQEARFKVVLNSSSCEAHGNIFRTTAPVGGTLTDDGCYESAGKQIIFSGPFAAGAGIGAQAGAPLSGKSPPTAV